LESGVSLARSSAALDNSKARQPNAALNVDLEGQSANGEINPEDCPHQASSPA
jgi:hypothetical protein